MMKKDIVIIIGGGGMKGIFSAGVLSVLEDSNIFSRIHSIYAVSAGADAAFYFLAKQSNDAGNFFKYCLTKKGFINKKPLKYLYQILRYRFNKKYAVEDIIDTKHAVKLAKNSKYKINIEKFKKSKIPFFVKVFNLTKNQHEYINTNSKVFQKLRATSTASPLSHKPIKINGCEMIDGNSISSNIDLEIIKKLNDKIIIKIENSFFSRKKFNLFKIPKILFVSILMGNLYGFNCFKKYLKNSLCKISNKNISKNVILIKNDIKSSLGCVDIEKLDLIYKRGIEKGKEKLSEIKNYSF